MLMIIFSFITIFLLQDHPSAAEKQWMQEQNIPRTVIQIFKAKKLDKKYDFSFHINPFYLRGDFDGDSIPDIAIMVKNKKSGKYGIAIVNGGTDLVYFIGGGSSVKNRNDDFIWMSFWHVVPKPEASKITIQNSTYRLCGEGISADKEMGGAFIYWNGKEYTSLPTGD